MPWSASSGPLRSTSSRYHELPPSMIVSPGVEQRHQPVDRALHERGRHHDPHVAGRRRAPPPSRRASGHRWRRRLRAPRSAPRSTSCTTQSCPSAISRLTMLAPMRPSPIIAICMGRACHASGTVRTRARRNQRTRSRPGRPRHRGDGGVAAGVGGAPRRARRRRPGDAVVAARLDGRPRAHPHRPQRRRCAPPARRPAAVLDGGDEPERRHRAGCAPVVERARRRRRHHQRRRRGADARGDRLDRFHGVDRRQAAEGDAPRDPPPRGRDPSRRSRASATASPTCLATSSAPTSAG